MNKVILPVLEVVSPVLEVIFPLLKVISPVVVIAFVGRMFVFIVDSLVYWMAEIFAAFIIV